MSKLVVVNGICKGVSYAAAFQWTTGTLDEALLDSPFPWGEDDGDWSELKVEVFDNELPEAPRRTLSTLNEMQAVRREMDVIRVRLQVIDQGGGEVVHTEEVRLRSSFEQLQIRYGRLACEMATDE